MNFRTNMSLAKAHRNQILKVSSRVLKNLSKVLFVHVFVISSQL